MANHGLRTTGPTASSSGRTYDAYGRLKTESTTYSGQTYTVTYDYNSKSQRESVTYPSGDVAEYTFDPLNRLDTIAWENNQLEDREYNANGMLASIDRAFEDEVRTYDDASRLLSISNTNVGSMTYTYDANVNVLSETLSGVMAPYGFTTQKPGASPYPEGYDSEDRYMRYIRAGVSEDILLSRSGIGNISSSTNNGTTISRTYNNVHALTAMGPATQAYDADGNATILHTGVTVDWDDAGRVQATHVGSSATAGIEGYNEYGYLDGKKLWRKITRGGSIFSHEVYIYNGPNRIADYASSQPATSPLRQRVFADEIDSISAIVQSNGDVLIATRNRQWSIVALTNNTNGSVLERYAYQTYGDRTIFASDGTTVRIVSSYGNDYGYTSREHLPESGLMYFRARHYDPFSGEFASQDPLEFVDGMSLYRGYFLVYCVDPLGTVSFSDDSDLSFVHHFCSKRKIWDAAKAIWELHEGDEDKVISEIVRYDLVSEGKDERFCKCSREERVQARELGLCLGALMAVLLEIDNTEMAAIIQKRKNGPVINPFAPIPGQECGFEVGAAAATIILNRRGGKGKGGKGGGSNEGDGTAGGGGGGSKPGGSKPDGNDPADRPVGRERQARPCWSAKVCTGKKIGAYVHSHQCWNRGGHSWGGGKWPCFKRRNN